MGQEPKRSRFETLLTVGVPALVVVMVLAFAYLSWRSGSKPVPIPPIIPAAATPTGLGPPPVANVGPSDPPRDVPPPMTIAPDHPAATNRASSSGSIEPPVNPSTQLPNPADGQGNDSQDQQDQDASGTNSSTSTGQ